MPKTTTTQTSKTDQPQPDFKSGHKFAHLHYYSELTRISAWLFIGVLALMTFLLSVGLQHPKVDLTVSLYSSIIVLALSLIMSVVSHGCHGLLIGAKIKLDVATDKDAQKRLQAKVTRASRALRISQLSQQVLFVLSVIAVASLAVTAVQLFTAAASTTSAAAATN